MADFALSPSNPHTQIEHGHCSVKRGRATSLQMHRTGLTDTDTHLSSFNVQQENFVLP